MPIAIFDLDGTLSDLSHRLHLLTAKVGDNEDKWKIFNDAAKDDPAHLDIVELAKILYKVHYSISIVSARSTSIRLETAEWLHRHGIFYDYLYMRKIGDYRSDVDVKRDIYETHLKKHHDQIRYVFEDRDRVVDFWRDELKLRCLQVQKGAY